MTLREWRRYVLKWFTATAAIDVAMFATVMWLLPVPGALCAPMIIGTGYVTDRVMKRRLDRRRPELRLP
jgi:Na+/melibiose symporter-like transporter